MLHSHHASHGRYRRPVYRYPKINRYYHDRFVPDYIDPYFDYRYNYPVVSAIPPWYRRPQYILF